MGGEHDGVAKERYQTVHLTIGHRKGTVLGPHYSHDAGCLQDFDLVVIVEYRVHKEIAGENGYLDFLASISASTPTLYLR
jgi:hypothetical protein